MNFVKLYKNNNPAEIKIIGFLGAFLALCFAVLYGYNGWFLAAQATMISFITIAIVTIASPKLPHRVSTNLLVLVGAITCYNCCFFTGGIKSTASIWFVNLLVFSMIICKLKDFMIWTIISILLLVSLSFVEPIQVTTDKLRLFNHMNIYLSTGSIIPLLVYYGLRIKRYKSDLERELASSNSESMEKDLYFKILSHDISTPLMSLMYATENKSQSETEAQEMIRRSLESIKSSLDTIKQYSESRSLSQEHFQKTSVNDCIRSAVDLQSSNAESKKISIQTEIEKTKNLHIESEPRLLINSIISNILTNAIKFSHKGGSIKLVTYTEKQKINIVISDDGVGFDKEYFTHSSSGKKYSAVGTSGEIGSGQGISIVEQLMRAHKGEFKIKSKKDNGSSIILTFPIFQDEAILCH